jgi:predicted MPP superfamily phosphohydrolase
MGVRFDLGSTSIVAYLTSPKDLEAPHLTIERLEGFLSGLAEEYADPARPRIISSSSEWVANIKRTAQHSLANVRQRTTTMRYDEIVPDTLVREVLDPLGAVLGSYDIYILPVGSWQDSDVLDRFGHEAARVPGHGILVLIPDYYQPDQNVQVLDPSLAATEAIRNRGAWPGAIFMLRSGEATFLPIDEARHRVAELAEIMHGYAADQRRIKEILMAPSREVRDESLRRLLHLSDLHFGTQRAADTQVYVQTALIANLEKVNQVVITGDLFDQPQRRHAQQYRNFAQQLQLMSGKTPIIIPGNHDQRLFGNAVFGVGRRSRELADLRWDEVVIDDEGQMAFFCFDSSRTGELARGRVDQDQLLRMATAYEVKNAGQRLASYLKVALVHHHPYAYADYKETSIIDPRGWVGRESFIAFQDADNFLDWCATRGVELILHGHKHIPRLIVDRVLDKASDGHTYQQITTVGCGSTLGANGSPMSFNLIEWDPGSANWNAQFMIDRGDGSGFRSVALQSQVI